MAKTKKATPKKAAPEKVEVLTECRVIKGFCLREGEFNALFSKNSEGQYVTHKVETKSGAIRHERTPNTIELNLDDLKAALKLKAVEVI